MTNESVASTAAMAVSAAGTKRTDDFRRNFVSLKAKVDARIKMTKTRTVTAGKLEREQD